MPPLLYVLSCALLTALAARAASPEDTIIRPGAALFDTDGNRLYAGGANIWLENGTYYLVGEGKKTLPGVCSECLNLYSSPDLGNWTFESCVLRNEDVVAPIPSPGNWRLERPKLFRCPANNEWRIWFHCDTPNFSLKSVGVMTALDVRGPWTFAAPCFRPDDRDSYDMGVYLDAVSAGGDGHAYLIRSIENKFAGISQMTTDCLNVTGIVSDGPDMEGQAIMRDTNGVLHALGSHLTGWAPNAAQFVTSPNASLVGAQWNDNINPSGSSTTYDSQSTFIFPFKHADGHTTFMYMGDRWNSGNPGPSGIDNMTMIWLPLIPPPAGPAPPAPAGTALVVDTCNSTSPEQGWSFSTSGELVHAATGLCAQGSNSGDAIVLAVCSPRGNGGMSWSADANGAVSNGDKGNGCLALNVVDDVTHQPGNPVVAYSCTTPPQWNDIWSVPSGNDVGLLTAHDKSGAPSDLCLAALSPGGADWTMPWHDEWSLKDF